MIDRIISALCFEDKAERSKPTLSTGILHKNEDSKERKNEWNYRSLVGVLNYLASTTRPDMMIAVNQCARFSENPKLSHEKAIKRIAKHLIGTKHVGIEAKIDSSLGLIAYADSDFANAFNKLTPENI